MTRALLHELHKLVCDHLESAGLPTELLLSVAEEDCFPNSDGPRGRSTLGCTVLDDAMMSSHALSLRSGSVLGSSGWGGASVHGSLPCAGALPELAGVFAP